MNESIATERNGERSLQVDESFTVDAIMTATQTAFGLLNRVFFNNELPVPGFGVGPHKVRGESIAGAYLRPDRHPIIPGHVIVVDTEGTLGLMELGDWDSWQTAVVDTVLHEMVHYYNYINGIADCDEDGIHNEEFRDAAMAHGLDCEYREETGWAATGISAKGWLTIWTEMTDRENDVLGLWEDE